MLSFLEKQLQITACLNQKSSHKAGFEQNTGGSQAHMGLKSL